MEMMINKIKIKNEKLKMKNGGFSLMEMLVVVFVFSILGLVATQTLALSLRGSKKSESVGEVRGNVEYAVSTMERLLRNAKSIDAVNSCTGSNTNKITYTDERGKMCWFECKTSGTDVYIASASAGTSEVRLTSNKIRVSSCNNVFVCNPTVPNVPASVNIKLTGENTNLVPGTEGASVSVSTTVQLRVYDDF